MAKKDPPIMFDEQEQLETIRHSLTHVLASAVTHIFPEVKLGIGPLNENGFYYDFELSRPLIPEDLFIIEEEMKKIIKKNYFFDMVYLKKDEVLDFLHQTRQTYKAEMAAEASEERLGILTIGSFKDLCREVHLKSTNEIPIDSFKLTSIAGAYWKGDESRIQLQRIQCVSYVNSQALAQHFENLELAKKRDHRKLGQELELFMFSEDIGAGLPLYLPKGAFIMHELQQYMYNKEKLAGYQYVMTPAMTNEKLYIKSGHTQFYKDSMYEIKLDNENFYLRPMNCPEHFQIYKSKKRSYRDLPIAYNEFANDYRSELSGAVTGLIRVRAMTQNDCHIFCTPEQAQEEFIKVLNMFSEVYKDFNIRDYWFRLSLPDFENEKEKYFQKDSWWDEAINIIRGALQQSGVPFVEAIGEASFYGPKLDVQTKNVLGKEDTIATSQLDFFMPRNFDMTYTNKSDENKHVVVIHRAIMGSFDRFFAFLIEKTGGNFPVWLAPIQARIIPIADRHDDFAYELKKQLEEFDLRIEVDNDDESMQNKIRKAQNEKIPYMLVIGDKEMAQKTISIRPRSGNDMGMMKVEEFIEKIKKDIDDKR